MLKFTVVNIITIIAVVLIQLFSLSIIFYILVFILWLIVTAIGSLHIRWNYHLNSLIANYKIDNNQVSITFDDGPHPEFTPKVLELLREYNVKASFFCIGENIEKHPELFQRIINEGHTIGNHTYSHSNGIGFMKTSNLILEMQQTNALIKKISGLEAKLFRPPFGVTNPRIKRAVRTVGLQSIAWSIRSLDTTSKSKESILNSISKRLTKGDVVLLHDTSDKSVEILEQLLLFLKHNKMEAVTVATLFNIKAYA